MEVEGMISARSKKNTVSDRRIEIERDTCKTKTKKNFIQSFYLFLQNCLLFLQSLKADKIQELIGMRFLHKE